MRQMVANSLREKVERIVTENDFLNSVPATFRRFLSCFSNRMYVAVCFIIVLQREKAFLGGVNVMICT